MIKRLFDIIVSAVMLLILALPMAIVAVLVHTKLGSPVLFKQQRPGKSGKPFMMIKFRSMKDADSISTTDEERLTPFGKKLRALSIDELPELWNVLKGDMSLVGPRPLLMSYLELYDDEQMRRHEVKPGITGWAQINGRNAISWEEKFIYDIWYVDNHNFWLDLKILFLTVKKVMIKEGISSTGEATMPIFKGNSNKNTD
ncbi:sugar transferase [Buttiauxella izardii]|uniref:Sugar transferase n=1 Tax=Buttiauxella izardii TaxID=82991 RepID=A0A3A5JWP0_9ENTR|nr:sugar transferase [Buttiauxella izardii]RJT27288.1 sugar transferase [Buttiauxella izardii]